MPDFFSLDVLDTHHPTSCSRQLSPIMGPLHLSIVQTGGSEFNCGPWALNLKVQCPIP